MLKTGAARSLRIGIGIGKDILMGDSSVIGDDGGSVYVELFSDWIGDGVRGKSAGSSNGVKSGERLKRDRFSGAGIGVNSADESKGSWKGERGIGGGAGGVLLSTRRVEGAMLNEAPSRWAPK